MHERYCWVSFVALGPAGPPDGLMASGLRPRRHSPQAKALLGLGSISSLFVDIRTSPNPSGDSGYHSSECHWSHCRLLASPAAQDYLGAAPAESSRDGGSRASHQTEKHPSTRRLELLRSRIIMAPVGDIVSSIIVISLIFLLVRWLSGKCECHAFQIPSHDCIC